LNKTYDSFFTSFGLISRIPIKTKYNVNFSLFGFFFPIIGLIVSALVLGLFYVSNSIFSQTGITVFIILMVQYLLFNLFHFDGLLDCADAFLYNTTIEKRLTILTDKRTGAFALFAGTIYLFFKIYLLYISISILNSGESNWLWIFVLFLYPLGGRIAGSIMPAIIPPAKDPGLAELLKNYSPLLVITGTILSLLVPATMILFLTPISVKTLLYVAPFLGAIISGISVSLLSKKMVGGYTGDSIGLTIEIGELCHLIIVTEMIGQLF